MKASPKATLVTALAATLIASDPLSSLRVPNSEASDDIRFSKKPTTNTESPPNVDEVVNAPSFVNIDVSMFPTGESSNSSAGEFLKEPDLKVLEGSIGVEANSSKVIATENLRVESFIPKTEDGDLDIPAIADKLRQANAPQWKWDAVSSLTTNYLFFSDEILRIEEADRLGEPEADQLPDLDYLQSHLDLLIEEVDQHVKIAGETGSKSEALAFTLLNNDLRQHNREFARNWREVEAAAALMNNPEVTDIGFANARRHLLRNLKAGNRTLGDLSEALLGRLGDQLHGL